MASKYKGGKRLLVAREAQGRSIRDVAKVAGVDSGYLSKVERGLIRPSVDFLARVGKALGIEEWEDLGAFPPSARTRPRTRERVRDRPRDRSASAP